MRRFDIQNLIKFAKKGGFFLVSSKIFTKIGRTNRDFWFDLECISISSWLKPWVSRCYMQSESELESAAHYINHFTCPRDIWNVKYLKKFCPRIRVPGSNIRTLSACKNAMSPARHVWSSDDIILSDRIKTHCPTVQFWWNKAKNKRL